MKPIALEPSKAIALDTIPEKCGKVTVGCTDVAGIVDAVINSSETLREEHKALRSTVIALEDDQRKVSEASDEARLLSERAIERLNEGTDLIQSSLGQIASMLDLVDTLAQHVTSFSAAMEQVRRSAKDIEEIAETTNILALNATIEAMRAGEAGRTFAVVADEVKSLANDTRRATEEIGNTIDTLDAEANQVIDQIEEGSKASDDAKASVAQIESTITRVGSLVEEVDKQNDVIARATGTISSHVDAVQRGLVTFDEAGTRSEAQLKDVHNRMGELEETANEMFASMVEAGLCPEDSIWIQSTQGQTRELAKRVEQAIESGELTEDQVFDSNYQLVEGSNPKLYRTTFSDWADKNWRPMYDQYMSSDPQLVAAVCSDVNGFMPTHMTKYSAAPTGELLHDTAVCRNGRILDDPATLRAKRNNAPYLISISRQEGDGVNFLLTRAVFVPLKINGKRWGDFLVGYQAES